LSPKFKVFNLKGVRNSESDITGRVLLLTQLDTRYTVAHNVEGCRHPYIAAADVCIIAANAVLALR
jgi:hypothetical protein